MTVSTFKLQIDKQIGKARDRMDLFCRKTVLAMGNSLVLHTPVGNPDLWKTPPPPGYVGGRARGSWQIGINSMTVDRVGTIDAAGAMSLARITAGVAGGKRGDVFYITNSLPYARELEYGHSTQAPHPPGIVGATLNEFDGIVGQALREVK